MNGPTAKGNWRQASQLMTPVLMALMSYAGIWLLLKNTKNLYLSNFMLFFLFSKYANVCFNIHVRHNTFFVVVFFVLAVYMVSYIVIILMF